MIEKWKKRKYRNRDIKITKDFLTGSTLTQCEDRYGIMENTIKLIVKRCVNFMIHFSMVDDGASEEDIEAAWKDRNIVSIRDDADKYLKLVKYLPRQEF